MAGVERERLIFRSSAGPLVSAWAKSRDQVEDYAKRVESVELIESGSDRIPPHPRLCSDFNGVDFYREGSNWLPEQLCYLILGQDINEGIECPISASGSCAVNYAQDGKPLTFEKAGLDFVSVAQGHAQRRVEVGDGVFRMERPTSRIRSRIDLQAVVRLTVNAAGQRAHALTVILRIRQQS